MRKPSEVIGEKVFLLIILLGSVLVTLFLGFVYCAGLIIDFITDIPYYIVKIFKGNKWKKN